MPWPSRARPLGRFAVTLLLVLPYLGARGADLDCADLELAPGRPIRVFHRLSAAAGQEDAFVRARAPGVLGSILLRERDDRSTFLVIERWASCEDWQATRRGGAAGDLVEVFEEVVDDLDYTAGSTMIRLYRVVIEPGAEEIFRDAWLEEAATRATRRGARGSLLLRDPTRQHAFVEVVRWNSERDWQASVRAGPGPFDAFGTLFRVRTLESKEVFDEVDWGERG